MATIVGVVVAVVALMIQLQDRENKNVLACQEIAKVFTRMSGPSGLSSGAPGSDTRTGITEALSIAESDSEVKEALGAYLESYDRAMVARGSESVSVHDQNTAFFAWVDQSYEVGEACASVGVRLTMSKGPDSADGSINAEDARSFCNAALRVATVASSSSERAPEDQDQLLVLSSVIDNGLPREVYDAAIDLQAAYIAGALAQTKNPADPASVDIVAEFCISVPEAAAWPGSSS
ncbi:hypothetical protein [Agromyces bracchium]|uniref:Uncharacterized protein n=1 Tax=Agromyces bracchium TaxID=88376 RepID=A0A6I3MBE2_9MICO|nr:hypothetical protein [Agromyces bracchium]MTH69452.1 hypothetical protein [Agromyces bracchium]